MERGAVEGCGERGVVGAVEGEAACVERGSMCACVEMESMRG